MQEPARTPVFLEMLLRGRAPRGDLGFLETGVDGDPADDSAQYSGSAFVFAVDTDGNWTQQAHVKASNTDPEDRFGSDVAVSADGSTLAIGATNEDSSSAGINGDEDDNAMLNAGAVYVFQ